MVDMPSLVEGLYVVKIIVSFTRSESQPQLVYNSILTCTSHFCAISYATIYTWLFIEAMMAQLLRARASCYNGTNYKITHIGDTFLLLIESAL